MSSSSTTAATSPAASSTAPLAKVEEAQLPIKGVVLFKHGVAYVEREGEVNNDSKIDLFFKSSEMNDVLKSLTVLDLNGGIVSSISYAANRSISDQLEDITVRIPERQSLTGLLNQLKGSRVKVVTKEDKEFEGVVLGTEVFNVKVGETEVEKPHLNILVGGAKLVTLDIIELKSVAFLDDHLKKDIEHLLNILISSKKKDSKQLTIHCAGKGGRTIYLSYVVAAPLWKTSYRLIVQPKKVGEKKEYEKECTLQAWALVDNTMDEDWTNVRLSLVSGLPISFIHDLYNPRYKKRPIVEVKTEAETGVPQLESAVSKRRSSHAEDPYSNSSSFTPFSYSAAPPPMALSRSEARASSTPVVVRNVEAGDLFHYEIAHAVTVKRNGAALVPIFFGKTECERLVVYNRKIREKNPMSSLLIKNTTNVALEGGPVTVYEDEAYVGEAMLDTLRANEEKMLPYSVELGVVVSIDNKSSNDKVHEIRIGSGYLYQYFWQVRTTIYNIDNKSEKSLTMVLEHEFAKGYDLFDTPEYIEKTENNYRFKMQLEPRQSTKFIVKEKYLTNSAIYLSEGSVTPSQIQVWVSSSFIDKEVEAKLQELANIVKTMNENRTKIQEIERATNEIFTDQNRVRENLKVLNEEDSKPLRQKYLKTLEAQEDQLKKYNTDKDALNKLIQQASAQFSKAVQGITFSKKL